MMQTEASGCCDAAEAQLRCCFDCSQRSGLDPREDVAQVSRERDRRKGGGQGKLVGRHVVRLWVGVDVSARCGRSREQRCRSRACLRRVEERSGRQSCEVSAALVNAVRDAPRLSLGSSSCRSGDSRRSAGCRRKILSYIASVAARHGQLHRVMRTHGAHSRKPPERRQLAQRAKERSGGQSHIRANDVFRERCRESLALAGARMIATPDVESHDNYQDPKGRHHGRYAYSRMGHWQVRMASPEQCQYQSKVTTRKAAGDNSAQFQISRTSVYMSPW